MSSAVCQKRTRLWRQTTADVSGCFILSYCHTESLSLQLPNDMWVAVYFCLHLYAQHPTLHIKSSCLQEEEMFILKNASDLRCLGKSFLWCVCVGGGSQNGPFSEVHLGFVFVNGVDGGCRKCVLTELKLDSY